MAQVIFTAPILRKLAANYEKTRAAQAAGKPEPDHKPVVRVFNPTGAGTWYFTEIDPDGDRLFGLCEIHEQELGYASKSELEAFRGRFGLRLERDIHFKGDKPLSAYRRVPA